MPKTGTDLTSVSRHIVLVPGFWLGAWAWDAVAARLRSLGHDVTAVTLPGLEHDADGRADLVLADQVTALQAIIDNFDDPLIIVAHSEAGAVLSGVLDVAPRCVAGVIYVDSGPSTDGSAFDDSLPPELIRLPLPSWDQLAASGASLEGLDRG